MKVLFDKKPLIEQLVIVWYRYEGKTMKEELLTDQDGLISFKVKKSGTWMVSTVKMEHLENNPTANWQSYWGSCTWGYEQLLKQANPLLLPQLLILNYEHSR